MKKCKYCQSEIDIKAKVCPHCRKTLKGATPAAMGCLIAGGVIIVIVMAATILPFVFQGFIQSSQNNSKNSGSSVNNSHSTPIDYKAVSYEEIARDPNAMEGEYFVFTGEVIQVVSNKQYRIDVTKTEYGYTDTIYLQYDLPSDAPRILEKDIITFYGRSDGFHTYMSILNQTITIPSIVASRVEIEKPPSETQTGKEE